MPSPKDDIAWTMFCLSNRFLCILNRSCEMVTEREICARRAEKTKQQVRLVRRVCVASGSHGYWSGLGSKWWGRLEIKKQNKLKLLCTQHKHPRSWSLKLEIWPVWDSRVSVFLGKNFCHVKILFGSYFVPRKVHCDAVLTLSCLWSVKILNLTKPQQSCCPRLDHWGVHFFMQGEWNCLRHRKIKVKRTMALE